MPAVPGVVVGAVEPGALVDVDVDVVPEAGVGDAVVQAWTAA
jgi:hypothetical protein